MICFVKMLTRSSILYVALFCISFLLIFSLQKLATFSVVELLKGVEFLNQNQLLERVGAALVDAIRNKEFRVVGADGTFNYLSLLCTGNTLVVDDR